MYVCACTHRHLVTQTCLTLQPHGPLARLFCLWGFSRQEHWSGLPFPSPGDICDPGIEPRSPTFQVDSLPSEPPGKPKNTGVGSLSLLQGIFPTQGSNQGLLHCRWILYQLSYLGSLYICPYSQRYDFSGSHVQILELDHKKGWALKNWCFQTVVLEKTLESPLDSKKIKPVNPKGNQPWTFFERTDAEAEAPILWPPDAKIQLTGKDPDAGKDWGQEEK